MFSIIFIIDHNFVFLNITIISLTITSSILIIINFKNLYYFIYFLIFNLKTQKFKAKLILPKIYFYITNIHINLIRTESHQKTK